jgi:hypothetical protein
MNVIAVSRPGQPDWRWRIVDYHGQTVDDSYTSLPTIAEANERLRQHADRDAPITRAHWGGQRFSRRNAEGGSAWEPTPWRAVEQAASAVLKSEWFLRRQADRCGSRGGARHRTTTASR